MDREKVYSTVLRMVGTVGVVTSLIMLLFCRQIAGFLGYGDHPEYVIVMYLTVALDAFTAIAFAYLRCEHKPIKFASLKIANIGLNIVLNLVYFFGLPMLHLNPLGIYGEPFHYDVVWVFYINLFCSMFNLVFLHKELKGIGHGFDKKMCRQMLSYAWPILVMGIAGQLNQSLSQIMFPKVYPGANAMSELGIYGACIKIAMIMMMITQAFRFAYEPFVFSKVKDKDSKEVYAQTMKYYIIFTLLAFLVVMAYLDLLKYLIGPSYWSGLRVVPIVMAAEIVFGVFFNLSFWYKLTDRTIWGAYFSGIGAVVLFVINLLLIPHFSYMACAWAGLIAYSVSMLLSYFIGQKYFPVAYPLRDIALYTVVAGVLFAAMMLPVENTWLRLAFRTVLLFLFVGFIFRKEGLGKMLAKAPVIGRFFR